MAQVSDPKVVDLSFLKQIWSSHELPFGIRSQLITFWFLCWYLIICGCHCCKHTRPVVRQLRSTWGDWSRHVTRRLVVQTLGFVWIDGLTPISYGHSINMVFSSPWLQQGKSTQGIRFQQAPDDLLGTCYTWLFPAGISFVFLQLCKYEHSFPICNV